MTLKEKIQVARERVRKMNEESDRLYKKYLETGEELYKEMSMSAEEQARETMTAIIEAERNLNNEIAN